MTKQKNNLAVPSPSAGAVASVRLQAQLVTIDGRRGRLISRDALDLTKWLRAQSINVTIEPNDGSPLYYVVRKGIMDVIRDPIFLFVAGIPVSVLSSLVANWIYSRSGGKAAPQTEPPKFAVKIQTESGSFSYDHSGAVISEAHAQQVLKAATTVLRRPPSNPVRSPHPDKPAPIYLEHGGKIVGWTSLEITDVGLVGSNAIITDTETQRRIDNGELTGLSITGIVKKSECSICGVDYAHCNHIAQKMYDGDVCLNKITSIELVEISVVREPVNSQCVIERDA